MRLAVRGHTPKQGIVHYCTLCGQHRGKNRGHRTTYSCLLCGVPLCMRTYPGLRKSCWAIWHSAKVLQPRSTPAVSVSNAECGEGSTEQRGRNASDVGEDPGETGDEAESRSPSQSAPNTGLLSAERRTSRRRTRPSSSVDEGSPQRRRIM